MEKSNYRHNLELIQTKYPDKMVLSADEVAKLVGLDRKTVYRMIHDGRIKTINLSVGVKRIPITELANWMSC